MKLSFLPLRSKRGEWSNKTLDFACGTERKRRGKYAKDTHAIKSKQQNRAPLSEKKLYIGQKRVQRMELHQHTGKCKDLADKHEQGLATKTLQHEIHARPKKDNNKMKNYWVII